jgi:hypothetical protein
MRVKRRLIASLAGCSHCDGSWPVRGLPVCRISPGQPPRFSPSDFGKACFFYHPLIRPYAPGKDVVPQTTSTVLFG